MTPRRPAGADAFPDQAVEPFSTRQPDEGALYAALDLGTNSCRMLIARPTGSQFQVIDSFSKPVQLGLGLEASGRLSRQSMTRTVHALQVCRRKLETHDVKRMRLVATEACRRARNSRDFLRMIKRETGLPVEIIAMLAGLALLNAILRGMTDMLASAEDAQEVCHGIRELVRELSDDSVADAIRILYGGSVKADTVAEIISQPDVDGGLVGGASLDGQDFAKLAAAAANSVM